MWLVVALVGYALSAIVYLLDKFVLVKTISRPVVFVFYTAIFGLLFFIAAPFVGNLSGAWDYLWALLCGLAFVASVWAIYIGIQKSEISHIGPLIGAVVPIFTFIWSKLFFHEQFTGPQLAAICLLVIGSFIIAAQRGEKTLRAGLIWGVLGAFLGSIFAGLAKYLYLHNSFAAGFVWSQAAIGVGAVLLIAFPAVRKSFSKSSDKSESLFKQGPKKVFLVFFDKFIGFVSLLCVQYAVFLGSITLVYALAGFQYAILVVAVAILSAFHSKFYEEKYVRGELLQEIFAVLLIGFGLALLV